MSASSEWIGSDLFANSLRSGRHEPWPARRCAPRPSQHGPGGSGNRMRKTRKSSAAADDQNQTSWPPDWIPLSGVSPIQYGGLTVQHIQFNKAAAAVARNA